MAKIKNGELRGKLSTPLFGQITGRRDGHIQTAEVKSNDPQSAGQMYQRLKMLTTAPLYRVLREAIALGWENIPQGQSLYNCFTGMAMHSTPFGISKELYDRGAYAWVHSRMEDGKMRVSTQSLITNNEAVLAAYGAPAKLRAAAKSLGADLLSEKFLRPTNSNARRALAAFGLSASRVKGAMGGADNGIIAVEYDGGMYMAGESGPEIKQDIAPEVKVIVSDGSVLGNVLQARINGESVTNPVRDGNTVTLTIPAALDGDILTVVTVMDVNHTWKIEL